MENDEVTAVNLFTIALEGFTYMDVHRSRAECMIRFGDIAKKNGDVLKALELWEIARPLFERSSQAKRVQDIDDRVSGISDDVKEQHRKNLGPLAEFNAPVGKVEEVDEDSSGAGELELDNEQGLHPVFVLGVNQEHRQLPLSGALGLPFLPFPSLHPTPNPMSGTPKPPQSKHWSIALVILQALVFIFILQSRFWDSAPGSQCVPTMMEVVAAPPPPVVEKTAPSVDALLKGPLLETEAPTPTFRENLRKEVKYITSWPANEWSSQVIQFMNLLYLARLTERVPIVPRFQPLHLKGNVSGIDFGDVFDLPGLRKQLKTPILEWSQVKDITSETVEDLGCWDVQHKTWEADRFYLEPPTDLNLDVSYTPVPTWVHASLHSQTDRTERSMLLWPLASLIAFNKRATSLKVLPKPALSPLHQTLRAPDDQLFCTNSLVFNFGLQLLESAQDLSPAWQAVGRHMHWTPAIEAIGANYTRQTLGIEPGEHIPPYIAVHIRRGDFALRCRADGIPLDKCLAPLSAYVRRVKEVRAEILEDTGVAVDRVIVTSDEEDSAWWEPVLKLGWLRPDHSRTAEVHGPWYPLFIDAVIQGAAYGFVGTDKSTVSILARRRVSSRGGEAEIVKWGRLGADQH
ncbi:hypothetical protein C8F04DRAFT_1393523 [Mycena alexandri]|uniref:GDP-fucose protein O-fucosyltransferase 2 n=1 Tax=Mycena alexandri TaxID=1745969 RepID=A0AAD6T385_9AGAR|nr:hypothetical protein C8F04DRAFT_1393523 [Mycena alexandri]